MTAPSVLDVQTWLDDLGLGEYAEAFAGNDIDAEVLADLTAEDLKEIGVRSVGHRRRMLGAIESLIGTPAAPKDQTTPLDEAPTNAAERRMLTVMFCDLVDSTALSVGTDPEDFADYIQSFRAAIETAVRPFDAHIAQFAGDGILAYFGYPYSSDHDAEKAVEASLAIVENVAALPLFAGRRPQVRIGLSTGLTVVGGVDRAQEFKGDSAVGETLNLAARLQSLAGPNGIIIAAATRQLLGEIFSFHDLGSHTLKGFDKPVSAWQVVGRNTTVSRFDALRSLGETQVFVGREHEIALLRDARSAIQDGRARFFHIEGEAGIGKSRLAREALFDTQESRDRGLVLQCSPYQKSSAFYPIRYLVERASGIAADDPPEVSLNKLQAYLGQVGPVSEERLEVVADMLLLPPAENGGLRAMSAYQRRVLTMEHLSELTMGVLQITPQLIIEDVQWIDPSTAEFLDRVFDQLQHFPALVVTTSRPASIPQWMARRDTVAIRLGRLTAQQTSQMIKDILGGDSPPAQVVEAIVGRCDGVPIFAEELTRGYAAGSASDETAELLSQIPATLAESVMARIDRLENGRKIASVAAAIGREFPTDLLISVSGVAEQVVRAGIRELMDAGIITPGYSAFGDAICFRQMLMRDAAYQLLLRRDRKTLHLKVVQALRESFPAIAEALPHVMAMQLYHAGDMEDATREWERAGQIATKRSAYAEAVTHLRKGLETNENLPPSDERSRIELNLRATLLGALIPIKGYLDPEVVDEMERANAVGLALGSTESIVLALYSRWVVLGSTGNVKASKALAFQMRDVAQNGTDIDKLMAYRTCATSLLFNANMPAAIEEYHRFMSLYDEDKHAEALRTMHGDHALMVMLGLSEAYTLAGDVKDAQVWRKRVIDAARKSKRVHDLGHVLAFAGCLHPMLLGDFEETALRAAELVDFTESNDLPFWRGHAYLFKGLTEIEFSDLETGFLTARRGVAELLAANVFSNCWYILMARACTVHGRLEEAEEMLEHARRSIDLGDTRFAPEYHRIKAQLARARNAPTAEPRAHLERARELSATHGTHLFRQAVEEDLAEYSTV